MALHFNEVTDAAQCEMFFEGLLEFPDLATVAGFTKAYRNQFGTSFAKGFLFDIGTIDNLRAQNGGNINALRVYMGIDNTSGTPIPVAVAVAVVGKDDFAIPLSGVGTTTAILAEGRPCPYECGTDNALNKS